MTAIKKIKAEPELLRSGSAFVGVVRWIMPCESQYIIMCATIYNNVDSSGCVMDRYILYNVGRYMFNVNCIKQRVCSVALQIIAGIMYGLSP